MKDSDAVRRRRVSYSPKILSLQDIFRRYVDNNCNRNTVKSFFDTPWLLSVQQFSYYRILWITRSLYWKSTLWKKAFVVTLCVTDREKCKVYQNGYFGGAICFSLLSRSSGILLFGQDLIITHLRRPTQTDRKGWNMSIPALPPATYMCQHSHLVVRIYLL